MARRSRGRNERDDVPELVIEILDDEDRPSHERVLGLAHAHLRMAAPADPVAADGAVDDEGPPLDEPAPPRRRSQVLAAVLTVAVLAAIVVVVRTTTPPEDGAAPSRVARGGGPTGTVPSTTAFVPRSAGPGVVQPTMVAPSNLPGDLRLVAGVSDPAGSAVDRSRVTFWSAASHQAVEAVALDGCPDRSIAGVDRATVLERAARGPSSDLRWCEDGVLITIVAGPSTDPSALDEIVRTISFARADGSVHLRSVKAPAGFEVIGGEPSHERIVLRYRSGASGDEVRLRIEGSDRWSLDRYASRSSLDGGGRGQQETLGARSGFVQVRAWATWIYLAYDDHTVVSVVAEGVPSDQARAIAASLAPSDPELAPPGSPDQFDRLWTP